MTDTDRADLIRRLRNLADHYPTSGQLGPENSNIFAEAAAALDEPRPIIKTLEGTELAHAILDLVAAIGNLKIETIPAANWEVISDAWLDEEERRRSLRTTPPPR